MERETARLVATKEEDQGEDENDDEDNNSENDDVDDGSDGSEDDDDDDQQEDRASTDHDHRFFREPERFARALSWQNEPLLVWAR